MTESLSVLPVRLVIQSGRVTLGLRPIRAEWLTVRHWTL